MKSVYIPYFVKRSVGGKTYKLDFFVYVVGNKVSGLENFEDIVSSTGINGTVIYAEELIKLYDLFKSGKISRKKFWSLFKSNKHLTWKDIDGI